MAKRFSEESNFDRRVEGLRLIRSDNKSDESRKVMDEVFDRRTMMTIYKLMTRKIITSVDFPISTGKEGNVFRATDADGDYIAMKIFRINNATFHNIARYIAGDPRFKGITGSQAKIIHAWTAKEFKNLCRLYDAKVRVPEPIKFDHNILMMEYIGTDEQPAPQLRQVQLDDAEAVYKEILKFIRLAYRKAELVHGDLSEYNILMHENVPYIIDCGQAVLTDHPNSLEFLKRDIVNINRYFRSLDVKIKSEDEILRAVIGVKS